MKDKKQKFVNIISALAIIFTLTFSTNMNATTAVSVVESPTTVALTSIHFTSIALIGNRPDKKKRPVRCKKCHRPHKGKCNGGGSTPSVPLDGGLGFLMLGAAAFGVKKLRRKKDAKS